MSKKKRYNFTLDEDLMMWFKQFCKDNRFCLGAFPFLNMFCRIGIDFLLLISIKILNLYTYLYV